MKVILHQFSQSCSAQHIWKRKRQTVVTSERIFVEGIQPGKVKLIGAFCRSELPGGLDLVDEHGFIQFKRKSPLKPGYFYLILPDYSNLHFLADEDQHFVIRTKRSDAPSAATIERSTDNEMLYASCQMRLRHEALYDSVSKVISGLGPNDPRYLAGKRKYTMRWERNARRSWTRIASVFPIVFM
ncbi:MAG: hypothetical protein U0T81_11770 [Saprospiraceae bacterium]